MIKFRLIATMLDGTKYPITFNDDDNIENVRAARCWLNGGDGTKVTDMIRCPFVNVGDNVILNTNYIVKLERQKNRWKRFVRWLRSLGSKKSTENKKVGED